MVVRLHRRLWHYLALLIVGAGMFLGNLGGASLWDIDEGKNATCTHEMRESGNWVVPKFNGQLRADKPVLLYWLQMAAYNAFGVNEFAARLPSALAALLTLILAYELGRALFGKATGLLGGMIAVSTPMLCGAARFANPDSLLHLCTVATLLIFWLGHRQPSAIWWICLGTTTGLGMLAKGPVGLVLPAAVAFLFLVWERNARLWLDRRIGLALAAWCFVALPWYIWVTVETKAEFLRGFFLQHNLGRFSNTMESHAGSVLYYPVVLLIGMAPWSIFLGGALWCALWSALRPKSDSPNSDPVGRISQWRLWATDREQVGHPEVASLPMSAYRFLLTWIATYVVFFSLSATKLPNYVLPVVVPTALLTARFIDRWRRGRLAVPTWAWNAAFTSLLFIGVGLGTCLLLASGVADLPALRGRFIPGLEAWTWVVAGPILGSLVGWWLWRRDRRNEVVVCLTLAAVFLLGPIAAWGSMALNQVKAPRELVEFAGVCQPDRDIRVGAWGLEHLPSLNFYVKRDVLFLQTESDLAGLLRYPLPVYVFLPAGTWQECQPSTRQLGREVARRPDFYRNAEIIVVTNQ